MSRSTTRFSLQVIEPGDNPYLNAHKFFAADRDLIDTLLWLALSGHVHDGASGAADTPATAPDLTLETTGGQIAAGARLWYGFTLVNDLTGIETALSPAGFIDTPEQVAAPAAPTLAWGSLAGSLLPGQYFYLLSAYTDVNTNETEATHAAGIIIPTGTVTNRVVLTLPSLPGGATGFNIYRRKPGGRSYLYVDSVDMEVATPPDEWVDDGSVAEDCDRIAPTRNTTNATNAITIDLPLDQVPLDAGYHWRLYRTANDGDWAGALIQDVVEETSEGSGIITTTFVDTGVATTSGTPPAQTLDYGSPDKIDLTDAAHVTGYLPMGRVSAFPYVVTLHFPGDQTVGPGNAVWPCPFEDALVVLAVAALGRGSTPAATDLIADVVAGRGATPVFTSVYAAQADMPTIEVGANATAGAAAATASLANRTLTLGDQLSADIIQEGGGATPTDEDLTVTVLLYVRVGDENVSQVWA